MAHVFDLCTRLEVPPQRSDPPGATYAFDKRVRKAVGGGAGRCLGARTLRREAHVQDRVLETLHDQVLRYSRSLKRPRFGTSHCWRSSARERPIAHLLRCLHA